MHKIHWSNMFSEPRIKQHLFGPNHWCQCTTFQVQINGDGTSKEIVSWHAVWHSQVSLRHVRNSQNVDVRWIRDVLDVAPVRKLDYHAQKFVNVVESVIEHKVVLCFLWDSQVTVFDFLFVFCVFCWELHLIVLVTCQKNLTLPKQKH